MFSVMTAALRCGVFATMAILLGGATSVIYANDSAASTAAGGIQLRHEANISMEKEVLTISEVKVTVEYEFLNNSDKDITTDVAFPIPAYDDGYVDAGGRRDFNTFHLWIDGQEIKYSTDVRADLNGKDNTELLKKFGIDIASLGHYGDNPKSEPTGQVNALMPEVREQLLRAGLVSGGDGPRPWQPLWKVLKTYYWTQTFPAHKILHVRHEYAPAVGLDEMQPDTLDAAVRKERLSTLKAKASSPAATYRGKSAAVLDELYKNIENSCVDPSTQKAIIDGAAKKYKPSEDSITIMWVDYILTTANSWKTPIKDFTLIVDKKPAPLLGRVAQFATWCWDGTIKKVDATHVQVHETSFIPKKELHVAFFSLPEEPEGN
jgi:hypothetical protein